jgi:hypothetical protein
MGETAMKSSSFLVAVLLVASVAFGANSKAAEKVCIDPHFGYDAHTLGLHDVVTEPASARNDRICSSQRPASA